MVKYSAVNVQNREFAYLSLVTWILKEYARTAFIKTTLDKLTKRLVGILSSLLFSFYLLCMNMKDTLTVNWGLINGNFHEAYLTFVQSFFVCLFVCPRVWLLGFFCFFCFLFFLTHEIWRPLTRNYFTSCLSNEALVIKETQPEPKSLEIVVLLSCSKCEMLMSILNANFVALRDVEIASWSTFMTV